MDNIKAPVVNEDIFFLWGCRRFSFLLQQSRKSPITITPKSCQLFFTSLKFYKNTGVIKEFSGVCHLCLELFSLFYFSSFQKL